MTYWSYRFNIIQWTLKIKIQFMTELVKGRIDLAAFIKTEIEKENMTDY